MGIKIDDDSDTAEIGDFVCFKADIEQYGRLIEIQKSMLIIQCRDDRTDELYTVAQPAYRCWKE